MFNREYLEKIGKEAKKSNVKDFKKFKNLERIEVERSWEAELVNQVIQNMEIRKELKDRLEANREEKEIIFYTDGSLSRESTRDKVVMGYSVVQVDSTNNEVFRYKGRIENWFSSTRAELVACLVAILVVPNECMVEIRIDSDAAIYAITNCLRNKKTYDWLKTKNNNILQAIKKVCRSKLV